MFNNLFNVFPDFLNYGLLAPTILRIILGVIVNFGSINPYSAKFLSNLVTFTLNFSIRKYFFRKN